MNMLTIVVPASLRREINDVLFAEVNTAIEEGRRLRKFLALPDSDLPLFETRDGLTAELEAERDRFIEAQTALTALWAGTDRADPPGARSPEAQWEFAVERHHHG